MKLKKLAAGLLAAVVAMTSALVTPVVSVAEDATSIAEPVLPDVEIGETICSFSGEHTFGLNSDGDLDLSIKQLQSTTTGGEYTFAATDIVIAAVTTNVADTSNWNVACNGFSSSWGGWAGVKSDSGTLTFTTTIQDIMDVNSIASADEFGGFILQVWNAAEGDSIKYKMIVAKAPASDAPETGETTDDDVTTDAGDEEPAADVYVYEYDGSSVDLAVQNATWTDSGLAAQANITIEVPGVTLQTTTFGELKELFSGIQLTDWAITNAPEGVDTSTIATSLILQSKTDWSGWHDAGSLTMDFSKLSAADDEVIMNIIFQINYNLPVGTDYEAGDLITLNQSEDEAALDPFTYKYDGSALVLDVTAASWTESGLSAQLNNDFNVTGVSYTNTTFAQLKKMYSGIEIANWEIKNTPAGISTSDISLSIFIQYKTDWSGWYAVSAKAVNFKNITAIADNDVIMKIGFQVNYNVPAGSSYAAGDKIIINDPTVSNTYSGGTYAPGKAAAATINTIDTTTEVIASDVFEAAKSDTMAHKYNNALYIYTVVSEDDLANISGATVTVTKVGGKTLELDTYKAFKYLNDENEAPEGCYFIAFVITGVGDAEFKWSEIETY